MNPSPADSATTPGASAPRGASCQTTSPSEPARDLTALFDPRSVAVVGASSDTSKWGGDVSARLLRGEHRRAVYLVNGRGGEVLGRRAYASLRELPEPPDLVVLAMPAKLLEEVVDDCVATGARAVVAVTAMLGEMGPEGRERERSAVAKLRDAGAVLVGPNCLGVADTSTDLLAVAYLEVERGPIGLISQSGGFGEELSLRMREFGLGFSRFVALGNQADVSAADILRSFAGHRPTEAVVVYAEELRDGRRFAAAAAALTEAGIPVVLLAPGRSEASARVAMTHTGSLTPNTVVVDAVCRAAGILRVNTQREAVELLVGLLAGPRPHGRRVGVVSDGGGSGAVAADLCALAGLALPAFSEELRARLQRLLPENAGCANPVDFAAATYDPEAYERVVGLVADSGEVDGILASGVIGFWSARFPEQAEMVALERASLHRMGDRVLAGQVPLLGSTPQRCAIIDDLRHAGLPIYADVESAVTTLARLAQAGEARPPGVRELPAAAPPLTAGGYWEARQALMQAGLPLVAACTVHDQTELLAGARTLMYPVALKAAHLLHKSDAGGVALDLADEATLLAAFARFQRAFGSVTYSLEQMADTAAGVEILLGCRWDAHCGPLVLVGLGGVLTEVFADVQAALAPITEDDALRLFLELRGASLFHSARGRPAIDLPAAARAAAALSSWAAAHPEVESAEINPLLVTPQGACGLDARVVLKRGGGAAEDTTPG